MEIVCDFSLYHAELWVNKKKTNHLPVIAPRAEWDENGLEMELEKS